MHVAGADDQLGTVTREPIGHRGVALVPVGIVVELEGSCRDPGRPSTLERVRLGPVRRDRHNR